MEGKAWMWVSAALLCTTIASSGAALYYYGRVGALERDYEALMGDLDELTIMVDVKIDYGNGTVSWHNSTRVPMNCSLLTATELVADVEYETMEFGALVTAIDGVKVSTSEFWLWDYYDEGKGGWAFGPVGADQWRLHNGDVVSWTYRGF